MPDEERDDTRYAVVRDEAGATRHPRQWWQNNKENFEPDWDKRKLFPRKASALAIIWRFRDSDGSYNNRFKFTLVRVRRNAAPAPMAELTPMQPAEERVP